MFNTNQATLGHNWPDFTFVCVTVEHALCQMPFLGGASLIEVCVDANAAAHANTKLSAYILREGCVCAMNDIERLAPRWLGY